ncbi:MAG: SigB/SigF/SigG family RNA polymerase sigma factor [Actinomycetota bacterium]|nr:SigB/SigF/SigG family RNA polymerase sigma factor [Actinomycetota bacterium]MCL6092386.1 SigB/SigF/SigG family RNA polymerase sigma factor [Actinomycetota bacterium]MDA8166281.1 SigB/SigF/SigG family RNA polymerase sigma factor [Actinomycetota bacterium]
MTRRSDNSLSKEEIQSLFRIYKGSHDPKIKNILVRAHLDLSHSLARRFMNRGEPLDDLVQVASMGLLKAIDRFDPDRNVQFTTYAVPTIVGELKRYFRDRTSTIRLPRGLRERAHALNNAVQRFSQEHGRSPNVAEISQEMGISEEDVIEGLGSIESSAVASLNSSSAEDSDLSLLDIIGGEDKTLETLDERLSLAGAMSDLSAREQNLLYLRFVEGLSQTEIANQLGISQMHVSRLLRRTLQSLRQNLTMPKETL